LRIGGTLLFVVLLLWLDFRGTLPVGEVLSALRTADPWLVLLSIAFYVPFLAIKAARWRLVSADMQMPLRWRDAWPIYSIGLAAGTFTPGQAGDVLKAWYLQRMGFGLSRALGSSVLDRLFDVAALALLGLLGVAVYGQRFARQTPVLVLLALAVVAVVALASWTRTRSWAVAFISKRLERFGIGRGSADGGDAWSFGASTIGWVTLLTGLSFATSIFRVWLLAGAVGIWLGPAEVAGYVGLTTAAALVPVTVGGVGTRDAVSALALAQLGHSAAQAIAVSLLILLLNLTQAIIGWVVWLRYRAAR
jgi:uncharacterized membrane protein YbhN (UPF0104 family)